MTSCKMDPSLLYCYIFHQLLMNRLPSMHNLCRQLTSIHFHGHVMLRVRLDGTLFIACSVRSKVGHRKECFINLSVKIPWKYCHFDEIFITGCTGSCQNDNFQCSQCWKFHQNDYIFLGNVSDLLNRILVGQVSPQIICSNSCQNIVLIFEW